MPPVLWMCIGLGLPWALALLSTKQWQSRALVAALALALGPALMSAWMLTLGVLGAQLETPLLQWQWIIGGSIVIALAGTWIAWRKRPDFSPDRAPSPLAMDEKLIVAMIIVALALRAIHIAYWPFTWYDTLWVYGYQGRLYFLEGLIPNSIDYYPQFLQLQYAYAQIVSGAINDHAARMVLPTLHLGSILAAYLLGERLISRRAGLFLAGLWSLHPFVGQWSAIGDLEIPLTFSFTLAAAFFLRAWFALDDAHEGRRNALIAGVLLGIALYTKPTAGAFVWGALLLLLADLLRVRFDIRRWMPRFMVAFWTGLACLPLGGVWYVRNILLGHDAITFPGSFWLTQARRSGDYLSWLALAMAVAFALVALRRGLPAKRLVFGLAGMALILAALLASNPLLFPERFDPPASAIRLQEAVALAAGLALLAWSIRKYLTKRALARGEVGICMAALALALPYFATFFFSYSYHYRLGFAVAPLLILPTAAGLSHIFSRQRIRGGSKLWRRVYCAVLILLGVPGIIAVAFDVRWSRVWLFDEALNNDIDKYQIFNPSLMEVVFGLKDYQRASEDEARVLAPGEERLPFFFPRMTIIDQRIETLDAYQALGATHFVYGAKARQSYLDAGIYPRETQLIAALGRRELFELKKSHYRATFSYELYQTEAIESRYEPLSETFVTGLSRGEIVFGERLRLLAADAFPPRVFYETPITVLSVWQAIRPLEREYLIELDLYNQDDGTVERKWVFALAEHRHGHYSTRLWDVDELVYDEHIFMLTDDAEVPEGDNYVFRLRVSDQAADEYLQISIDGVAAGEIWQLDGAHQLRT